MTPEAAAVQPHELLDDGLPVDEFALIVIGCGNVLRGDDAVGPLAIRALWESSIPDGVRIADGGTAGMDVAFAMRGARSVVIIDAAATGSTPGTVYRVPGADVEQLPPVTGMNQHAFRWDHALAFGRWLLGPHFPDDVTVYLIEAAQTEYGADLSDEVAAGMREVCALIEREHFAPLRGASA